MSDEIEIDVHANITHWDARTAYPEGVDGPDDQANEELTKLLRLMGSTVATAGQCMVLPGPEPHQAIIITMDGIRVGAVDSQPIVLRDVDPDLG